MNIHYVKMLIVIFTFLLPAVCRSDMAAEQERMSALFQKYKIPQSLRHNQIYHYLCRMEWQYNVSKTNNWLDAARHPAMPPKNYDYRGICLEFTYGRESKDKYRMAYFSFHTISDFKSTLSIDFLENLHSIIDIDDNGKIIKYIDNLWVMGFHENGCLSEFMFPTKNMFPSVKDFAEIEWDENGKEIYNPYAKISKSFWDDVYQDETHTELLKHITPIDETISTKPPQGYELRIPADTANDDIKKDISELFEYDKNIRKGNLLPLLNVSGFEKNRYGDRCFVVQFHTKTIARFKVYCIYGKDKIFGYHIEYDKENRLIRCTKGEMNKFAEATAENEFPHIGIDGSGFEITFHVSGYPASYKSIVDNQLFGPQVEWNESGGVIKKENYESPHKWADAPARK